ncbi:hypothetical protein C0V75_12750 [Tabrizicola sp. TH137]|uniref:glycosyltransferase family 4 protein n=1 Tax=Tabrizicola sp. TH137 TaxID=2067452 RepID=UPI000C7E02FD|nr:glycosyltransferase family 4 protein [Tabrizicola sp. TH137]PLL11776.1 hypothetical protein C0V75_12750 [Tabrizicola sp. TH137]
MRHALFAHQDGRNNVMSDNPRATIAFLTGARIIGGAEIRLKSLMLGLATRGFQPVLVAPATSPIAVWALNSGLTVVNFDFRSLKSGSILETLRYVLRFRRLVRKLQSDFGVDVAYSNSRHAFTVLAFAPRGVTRIAHHRDAHSSAFNRILYPLVDLNIFISKFNYRASDAPKNAVIVVNAIDLVEPLPPKVYRGGKFRMAMFARITSYKGHLIALDAVRELVARGVDCCLDVWGEPTDSYDEQLLESLVAEVAKHKIPVNFRGFTESARERMADYDLLLNPSRNEPFGTVPIEGFNVGVPVVSHASGGSLEIYPKEQAECFLFDDYSGQSLADKIDGIRLGMVEGDDFLALVSRMQQHVVRNFSNTRVFGEIEQAIIQAMRGEVK